MTLTLLSLSLCHVLSVVDDVTWSVPLLSLQQYAFRFVGSYYWVTSTDAVLSKHQSAVAAGERGTRPRSCFQCYLSACLWSNRFFGGSVKEVLMKCGSCIRCTLLVTSFYSRCRSSNAILQIMHAAQLSYYLLTCCPYLHWSLFLVLTALCVHHGP